MDTLMKLPLMNTWHNKCILTKATDIVGKGYRFELIEGMTEDEYVERLGRSVKSCVRMLKTGRWLSIVFQHWKVEYFEAILTALKTQGASIHRNCKGRFL